MFSDFRKTIDPFDELFQGMAFPNRKTTFDCQYGKIGPVAIGPEHEENR